MIGLPDLMKEALPDWPDQEQAGSFPGNEQILTLPTSTAIS